MERLRFKEIKKQCKGVKFDEIMDLDGSWESTQTTEEDIIEDGEKVRELDYKSNDYTYFLRESENGYHTMYRVEN